MMHPDVLILLSPPLRAGEDRHVGDRLFNLVRRAGRLPGSPGTGPGPLPTLPLGRRPALARVGAPSQRGRFGLGSGNVPRSPAALSSVRWGVRSATPRLAALPAATQGGQARPELPRYSQAATVAGSPAGR